MTFAYKLVLTTVRAKLAFNRCNKLPEVPHEKKESCSKNFRPICGNIQNKNTPLLVITINLNVLTGREISLLG